MTHVELPHDLASQDLAGAGSVFRNRSFVSLWTAQLLSQLASNMVLAGLMAIVFGTTGSNTATAVLILTFLFPAVAFSAIAGVIVERSDAKVIMFTANVLRAVGTILFIFVGANVLLIYVINLLVATVTAFFAPAELTSIPRIVQRRHLMAANSVFVLTVNASFAIGFGFLGPLLLTTVGSVGVYVVVAVMFGLAGLAILAIPAVPPEITTPPAVADAGRALTAVLEELREGLAFVRRTTRIAWSLTYLGIASSLIGVMGALGPGFATQILRLRAKDFFFIMGPAGLGAVVGILFLNSYGRSIPRRLVIDIGLVAMGITLMAIAAVKPVAVLVSPAVRPIQSNLPELLSPFVSLIAVVVVIAVTAGIEYAFVAIPSQTALQEDLPAEVRARIFGILNTLLSVASFLPVLLAPAAADVLNILFPGAGVPVVMGLLGAITLWAGIASWRHNERAGLHGSGRAPASMPSDADASGAPDFGDELTEPADPAEAADRAPSDGE